MRKLILCLLITYFPAISAALAENTAWQRAKNTADDIIYAGKDRTFYCGFSLSLLYSFAAEGWYGWCDAGGTQVTSDNTDKRINPTPRCKLS